MNDTVGGQPIVLFHADGVVSPLDAEEISASRDVGAAGVFVPLARGHRLSFHYENGAFVDEQTHTRWDVTGRAVAGAMEGQRLEPVPHSAPFAFAWFAFYPQSGLYGGHATGGPQAGAGFSLPPGDRARR